MEAIFPVLVCLFIFVITPESPRFLVKVGKHEKARRVIAKYHTTSGSLDEPLVELVVKQIEEALENEKAISTPWWDYRVFFTRRVSYRLLVLGESSFLGNCTGGQELTSRSSILHFPTMERWWNHHLLPCSCVDDSRH